MSNPLRAPKIELAVSSGAPSAYFEISDEYASMVSNMKRVEQVQERLRGLDMDVLGSFVVPKQYCVDPSVLGKASPLALAKTGKPVFRVRTGEAYALLSKIFAKLPLDGIVRLEEVSAAIRDKFYVDAGTEMTLGRLEQYYPKIGAVIQRPVTRLEAEAALDNCGVRVDHLPSHAVRPFPLVSREDASGVSVNPKSDNGFPVLGQWDAPGASALAYGLAVSVRKELVALGKSGIIEWKARQEVERPWLVTLRGKAKGDYYSAKKIKAGALRFYNAFPRQITLNMQVATQALEALSRSIFEGSQSSIGISLVRRGGERLVQALQDQLDERGWAYTHLGDDSWVAIRVGSRIVCFALDCSSFDLTQHATATKQVHEALRRQLHVVDFYAGELWYAYARERSVVVAGALVRRWKHAGPSGMPLQSKVNDMLMDVLINRALATEVDWTSERAVDSMLTRIGSEMGFVVRVEQHNVRYAVSLKEFLTHQPFVYIGYMFHVLDGNVAVCADIARTMSQMPYPGLKWMKTDKERIVMESMRLGSIAMNAGMPPRGYEAAFQEWRTGAAELVTRVLAVHGDVSDAKLGWAVGEIPWATNLAPSLSGLLRVLLEDPGVLWMQDDLLPSTSRLVLNWADMVEEEEEMEVAAKRLVVPPPAATQIKAIPLIAGVRYTHPVTERNDGRMPPTAVWGPPRPPRRSPFERASRVVKRRGRILEDDIAEEEWSEHDDDFFDDFDLDESESYSSE